MALSGMAIFKHLPKTNCGQCGVPTCLAFAMKLAAAGASLDQCPFVSDAAKAVLAEASAPPIRGVTIGEGEFALKIGEELVMHRHEKTFFNPCGYALLIEDTEDAAAVTGKLAALKQNDGMLQAPTVSNLGKEVWRTKEAKITQAEAPQWGDGRKRGIVWEALTATALMMAGSDILIMRHPEAVKLIKKTIAELGA